MSIYEPNQSFDFSKVSLTTPTIVAGGNYFIKFRMTDDEPLYIQPPKCTTKQGFVKTHGGKKMYCDLVFTNTNESFIKWVEDLEKHAQESIFHNRDKWFESQLELEDIENSFAPSLKIYKSGKMYLLRTSIPTRLGNCGLKIFNEDQTEFDINEFKETTNTITILEIQGVKCSSKSFQLEIEIKQMMVLKPNVLFDKCVIKSANHESSIVPEIKNTVVSSGLNTNYLGNNTGLSLTKEPPTGGKEVGRGGGDSGGAMGSIENKHISPDLGKESSEKYTTPNQITENKNVKESSKVKLEESGDIRDNYHPQPNHAEKIGDIEEYSEEEEYSDEESNDDEDEIMEVDFDLDSIDTEEETINLKERDAIYTNIYKEVIEKSKEARNLAIYSYLESKRIKNLHLIQ